MIKTKILSSRRRVGLLTLAGLSLCLQAPLAAAQGLSEVQTNGTAVKIGQRGPVPLEQRGQVNYDAYILGPGDGLQIELLDLPELSGNFRIGPDGSLYLPRLRALYAEGLTVEELRNFLREQFKTYVRDPEVFIRPVSYRPVRVYVGGEVKRPGYYTLTGVQSTAVADNTSLPVVDSRSAGLQEIQLKTRLLAKAQARHYFPPCSMQSAALKASLLIRTLPRYK